MKDVFYIQFQPQCKCIINNLKSTLMQAGAKEDSQDLVGGSSYMSVPDT